VAVFGCGPVGLLTVMCAQLMGASLVIGVDPLPDRLALVDFLNGLIDRPSRRFGVGST
jgi:threonine dehydrogenase-like Zn-dependent dehydrogenase